MNTPGRNFPGLRAILFEQQTQQLDEYSQEPKRGILDLNTIGLDAANGLKNILAVYNQATPEEQDYWGRWYHHAHDDVKEFAQKYQLDFPVAAGVIAVLSPGNKWRENLMAGERLMLDQRINAYPINIDKAKRILAAKDPQAGVGGPKVTVFFHSLMEPKQIEREIVLDGHAMNIWWGNKRPLKNLPRPTNATRQQMVADYQAAAEQLGVTVQAVQAVTWYIWKYAKH